MQIILAEHDPNWSALYASEARRINKALGKLALRVDHVGSTSVPELAAKPVIDIQISVTALEPMQRYLKPLQTIGYTHMPHADDAFCPFLFRPRSGPHAYHVHLVEAGGLEERRVLAFRDYLREHPPAAAQYQRLKQELAKKYDGARVGDHERYAQAKTEFIETMIARALDPDD
jgi:GrpB-like predicted nucleotidyltransferase (UPF0157 family)